MPPARSPHRHWGAQISGHTLRIAGWAGLAHQLRAGPAPAHDPRNGEQVLVGPLPVPLAAEAPQAWRRTATSTSAMHGTARCNHSQSVRRCRRTAASRRPPASICGGPRRLIRCRVALPSKTPRSAPLAGASSYVKQTRIHHTWGKGPRKCLHKSPSRPADDGWPPLARIAAMPSTTYEVSEWTTRGGD